MIANMAEDKSIWVKRTSVLKFTSLLAWALTVLKCTANDLKRVCRLERERKRERERYR